jgi:Disulphide bond corrector protein DsbC
MLALFVRPGIWCGIFLLAAKLTPEIVWVRDAAGRPPLSQFAKELHMNRIIQRGALCLLALAVLLTTATLVSARGKKSDSVAKVTVNAEKPDTDGKQVITVNLVIDPDWHVYANPVGKNEIVADAATTIEVKSATAPEVLKIEYPAGKLVKIYEDKVAIKVHVRRKGNSPLELAVKLVSCNDKLKQCLQPATVKLTVP